MTQWRDQKKMQEDNTARLNFQVENSTAELARFVGLECDLTDNTGDKTQLPPAYIIIYCDTTRIIKGGTIV